MSKTVFSASDFLPHISDHIPDMVALKSAVRVGISLGPFHKTIMDSTPSLTHTPTT